MKKRFHIKLLGQELSVLSDSADDHVARVVQYVNEKAGEIAKMNGDYSTLHVALLTALNIADEYIKIKLAEEDAYRQLETISDRLMKIIEDSK